MILIYLIDWGQAFICLKSRLDDSKLLERFILHKKRLVTSDSRECWWSWAVFARAHWCRPRWRCPELASTSSPIPSTGRWVRGSLCGSAIKALLMVHFKQITQRFRSQLTRPLFYSNFNDTFVGVVIGSEIR